MMTDETTPYDPASPGQVITAERYNQMQIDVKEDIHEEVEAAKADIRKTGVDQAVNADKFEDKAAEQWTADLDQRYAEKIHDHEGQTVYRRYIKEFSGDPGYGTVLLKHGLGRYPLIDVYELMPVATVEDKECKLLFYYGHADAETYNLWVKAARGGRAQLGIGFDQILAELEVAYEDDDTITDVLNEMWNALMADPNDEIAHCTTQWIDDCCERNRTIEELKRADQWNDLYLAIRPRKCGKGADNVGGSTDCQVEVQQVNYDTLYVSVERFPQDEDDAALPLDLMLLLRI
jgi:hypothetical protein